MSEVLKVKWWVIQDICIYYRDVRSCIHKDNKKCLENDSCREELCPVWKMIKQDKVNKE